MHSVEIIRYRIPEAQQKAFEAAYKAAGAWLQEAPQCLGYEIINGVEEPDRYIVRIHWTSVDDHLNGFRKSTAFRNFYNLVKDYFNNIEEMKHYHPAAISWTRQ